MRRWPQWLVLAGCLGGAARVAGAQPDETTALATREVNRTYVGQELFVAKGQRIANATCLFCSAEIEGDVTGRVLVLFGNLTVTGNVGGNAAVVDGNAVLDEGARLSGNAIVLFGNAVYETDDVIGGSAYVLGGHASSFETRERMHRRFSLTPKTATTLAILVAALLAIALAAGSRQRQPR